MGCILYFKSVYFLKRTCDNLEVHKIAAGSDRKNNITLPLWEIILLDLISRWFESELSQNTYSYLIILMWVHPTWSTEQPVCRHLLCSAHDVGAGFIGM